MESVMPDRMSFEDTNDVSLLFGFEGRISRSTYWRLSLVVCFFLFAVYQFAIMFLGRAALFLVIVCNVPGIWISLALHVKRWHDRDKSAWMALIYFIPLLGAFWASVELGFLRGTVGENRFGPDPTESVIL